MQHLPSSSSLKAFEAAGRHLSFLQAARELNVTAGAVSRQIQSLEDFLGRRLFVRYNRRVELTPLGREFLVEIQAPLQQIADAAARVHESSAGPSVSILAYPTFAIRWLMPRWGSLHDHHPQIDIHLTTSLNPVDFERSDYGMAIQVLREGEERAGLATEKLVDVVTVPICAPELRASLREPQDLCQQTLLHSHPRPGDWHKWLAIAGVSGVDPRKGLHFESSNLAYHAAIEGLGVAIAIEALVRDDLEQGRLVRPFEIARRSGHPMQLVYPRARVEDPDFVAVRDWLLQEGRRDRA
ncbi:MAG: LysR substrate-binding domain-containing protein [Methyloligellaceae bacterium]